MALQSKIWVLLGLTTSSMLFFLLSPETRSQQILTEKSWTVSSFLDFSEGTLSWEGETPFATSIQFQVRGGDSVDALRQSKWKGPEGEGSFYIDRHATLKGLLSKTRYFQFKATLVGPNGASTPVLGSTSIGYH